MTKRHAIAADDIAIVGMAVNVPGAADVDAYWANLRDGVESIRRLSEKELRANGETPENIAHSNYVPAAADLKDFDHFDAEFFGFSPKDAAILDPQHRCFLEVAWTAMEQAGHPPETISGPTGVYAGCGMGSYFYFNICSNPDLVDDAGMFLLRHTGNDKDFLTTRVSHVFDLKGPSINVQTACSTSLVAIHYACQALRAGEVEMALAGGVTIELPQGRGYLFRDNEVLSPDGHCHAFDHRAQGTVFGSGAGCVALRRLADAVADGDHIWAVIKGSAVNNDGAAKAGYLAPSVDGQTAAIAAALNDAGVAAQSIGMVECHGTGTYLGDPIEVAALTQAYRAETQAQDFCRIGSVKTNIGHLDTAAGVAGLTKAALALHHRQIPPSLGYEAPNPAIPFEGSPFRVNDRLSEWQAGDTPRRAAVNALGVGGTNAHMILEQAPDRAASGDSDWPFQPLVISGHSKAALDANTAALAAHLRSSPDQPLADVAHTLKNGRRAFGFRRVVTARTHAEAADLLETRDNCRVFTHEVLGENPEVVFMFPGGGAQTTGMARDLYETEPVFADWMDRGLDHLQPQIDYDIRALWLPDADKIDEAARRLKKPSVQLPLIAIVEYALAQLWISWGIRPAAMVGHSMGENVAACLAGVMSFENLIDLVLLRGQLFDEVPAGGMLSVSAPLEKIAPLLGDDLDIASINAPELISVSGSQAALDAMQARLQLAEIECQRIAIDIAAHSRMLDPILDRYRAFLATLDLRAPQIPFVSNHTGEPVSEAEATSPDYWVGQLRNCVNFADCIATLAASSKRVFLEVGPGRALSGLAQMNPGVTSAQVIPTLRHPDQDVADNLYFITMFARLWACGVTGDWSQIWGDAMRNRVLLPTYRFQRSRYFIEPGNAAATTAAPVLARRDDIADWGSVPVWRAAYAETDADALARLDQNPRCWLIFMDDAGIAAPVVRRLRDAGHEVITVQAGDGFARVGDTRYTLAAEQGRGGYDQLIATLRERDTLPERIAHFWLAEDQIVPRPGSSVFDHNIERGFWSLTWLAQSLTEAGLDAPLHIDVFTTGAAQVQDEPLLFPEKALISGPVGVFAREMPGVTCAQIDLAARPAAPARKPWFRPAPAPAGQHDITDRLLEDMLATPANLIAAHRGDRRFVMSYKPMPLPEAEAAAFRDGGTYLITGGFGGIGQTLAADILANHDATVILLSRDGLPDRATWEDYLNGHGTADRSARRMRAVLRLESLGRIEVAGADVANIAQMRRVIDGIMERHGSLTGVIHAAGVLDDGPLLSKTDAQIDAVLSPKVQGLRVLDQLLPDGTCETMLLFSSTSTATRAAGQVDYVAANAWLNAFAVARQGCRTRVTAINWGVWADVGMGVDAIGGSASDVLPSRPLDAALLKSAGADTAGDPVFLAPLSTQNWVLDQHRTRDGVAVMPGTGYVELLAEAAHAQGMQSGFEIRDLYFLRAMTVAEGDRRDMELTLRREGDGFAAELRSDCVFQGKPGWQLHAEARIAPLSGERPPAVDLASLAAACPDRQGAGEETLRSPQEAHLKFGPRWHVLTGTRLGKRQGIASLRLPQGLADDIDTGHLLHAGLMDLATGWALHLMPSYGGRHLWVPVSFGAIRVFETLPAEIRSWVRLVDAGDGEALFDVTLTDGEGNVLVEISHFAMKRLAASLAKPAPLDAREVRLAEDTQNTGALSPADERLAWLVSQGIRAVEGPEALRRAVALGRPQVMVSALPLNGLIAQADRPATEPSGGAQSFERADLEGFVAPEGAVQQGLAAMWEKLLGVSPVGAQDSFFDLGGHSLIAVRLFAAIKREFRAEFPISALFEAPTIAALAALIAEETGDVASLDADTMESPVPKSDFLVPLNRSDRSDATPLFVVAGMFGNVLNLRHLALPFNAERRVFGVQARGLVGNTPPHTDVSEAATDYLHDIRQIQPEGPYLLAGYSGGGIIAYEMAQQLRAAGQEVAVLAMLDTPLPVRPVLSRPDRALIKIAEMRRNGPRYLIEWARNRWAWEKQRRLTSPPRDRDAEGVAFNDEKIRRGFLTAVGSYETPRWDGPMTLFRPPLDLHWRVTGGRWVSSAREYVFEDNDWRRFAPDTEVIEVPGDHETMVLTPNVAALAQELREVIARALAAAEDWPQATAAE